jgi:hypothetical protein
MVVTLGFSTLNFLLPSSVIETYQTNYSTSHPRRQLSQEATVHTNIMRFTVKADKSVPAQFIDEAAFLERS